MNSTVWVTGGAGFIGSFMCEALLDRGADVWCIDSLLSSTGENVGLFEGRPGFHFVEADICEQLPGDLPAPELSMNLACPASPVDFGPLALEILEVCTTGMANMLEQARRHGAILVQASTSEVYGEPEVHPQSEDYWGHVNSIGVRSCYDEGKRCGEALAMAFRRAHGVDARLARIFNTYGPRMRLDDGRVVPNFMRQAFANEPLTLYGDGSQTRSFCYVTDTVAGLLALADADADAIDGANPAYNVGNGVEITIAEFAEQVRLACESTSEIVMVPLPQKDDPTRRRPVTTKLRELSGWRPVVSLEEGLARAAEWFAPRTGGAAD